MSDSKTFTLTDADRTRIQDAVRAAESQTSGEIVPYIVSRSDVYASARWRAGLMGLLLGALIGFSLAQFNQTWGFGWLYTNWGVVVMMFVWGAAAFLAAWFVPAITRFFAGYMVLNRRVEARAAEAFLAEEVFNTRDRTGILLFISLLEHRILVVGDSGINAKVKQEEWDAIVKRIKRGIKEAQFVDGLVEAIKMCGELLQHKEVVIKPDDQNELADTVRFKTQ